MWFLINAVLWNCFIQINGNLQNIKESIGPVNFHAEIGTIPEKYPVMDDDDIKASQKISTLIEMLRPAFPTKFGSMPALDPFKKNELEPFTFNLPVLWLSGRVNLKNLLVKGAQKFTLQTLELRLRNSRSDFSVNVPELTAEVDLDVHATLSMLPVIFGGHLSIVLSGVSMTGATGAGKQTTSDNRQVFQLESADLNADIQDIQIYISNLHLGEGMGELDKSFSITKWVDHLQDDITRTVMKEAMDELNSLLKSYTVEQIMTFLLS